MILQRAANITAFIGRYGWRKALGESWFQAVNRFHERRLGVETAGMVMLADLGIHNKESVEYVPIGYAALYRALRRIPLPAPDVSFVDFGAGKGRALAVAGTFPFRKVVGVEFSPHLAALAKANIQRMRHRRARSLEVVLSDAAQFAIEDDVNVVYFFNAFIGTTLELVVRNIVASHEARPRTMYIVYFNTIHFEKLRRKAGYDWIRPIHTGRVYPNYSFCIYEIPAVRPAAPGSRNG